MAPTDRQRLLLGNVPQSSVRSDRQLLAKPIPAQMRPKRPMAGAGTFAIYGKDGTFLSIDFGFGRLARRIDLYDYLPAGLVPHLANLTFELTGALPDAFGLDIGVGGGLELNNAFAFFPSLAFWVAPA